MKAQRINQFSITEAGGGKGLLGDINGDGRMEVVFVQVDYDIDDRYIPHTVTCVTAFSLDGTLLWQTGKRLDKCGNFGSDFPAQIYDIDDDGNLEIVCVMEGELRFLDGRNGKIKKTYAIPAPNAHDCIMFADFHGKGKRTDIVLKDRYETLYALDNEMNLMWTHKGNIGHFPYVYDINNDGFDEIMAGYDMLDHNGHVIWSCHDLEDHADCLWVGDVNGDGVPEIAVGGSVTCLYDIHGNEIWRYEDTIESQHIAMVKFDTSKPGLQLAGLDRIRRGDGYKNQWDGKDGMFLISSDGKTIWKEDRKTKGWLTIVDTLRNWNGEGKDYILAYRRGGGVFPTLYDGKMSECVTFDTEGYVIHADLFGRGIEDVIVYTPDEVVIYSGTPYDLSTPLTYKKLEQTRRLYTSTLYPGGEYTN